MPHIYEHVRLLLSLIFINEIFHFMMLLETIISQLGPYLIFELNFCFFSALFWALGTTPGTKVARRYWTFVPQTFFVIELLLLLKSRVEVDGSQAL